MTPTIVLLVALVSGGADSINAPGGLALRGYDPVAYGTDGKALRGKETCTYAWRGARWQFADEHNRELFRKDPEAYVPQFGGYCAWAVGHGYTADADPEAWCIVNGKLYVNYSTDVRAMWKRELPGIIGDGERNWKKLTGKQ